MRRKGSVCIMSNRLRTVLYVEATQDLKKRVLEHKESIGSEFAAVHECKSLVYYENYNYLGHAVNRAKQLKMWKPEWKEDLVKSKNPKLKDLTSELKV